MRIYCYARYITSKHFKLFYACMYVFVKIKVFCSNRMLKSKTKDKNTIVKRAEILTNTKNIEKFKSNFYRKIEASVGQRQWQQDIQMFMMKVMQ